MLAPQNKQGEYVQHSDASKYAVCSSTLTQTMTCRAQNHGLQRKKLQSVEMWYTIHNQQPLSIDDAAANWHYWLHLARYFTVHTDFASLWYTLTQPSLIAWQMVY